MKEHWRIHESTPNTENFPELSPVTLHLLANRGITTQEAIDEFLSPDYSDHIHDPFLFSDMEKAVARIFTAMENNERITIHGDYDADGISGSVVLFSFFEAMHYTNVSVFLPHRETDGYGLNSRTVETLQAEGTRLIITCDCGISNTKEVARANELDVDVIITDHHTIPQEIPEAFAIIHPKIETETYPDKNLSGGGVAFKLVQGLLAEHKKNNETLPNGERHEAFEKWQLDMVAISTVADMVPLIGESRTLTRYGLVVLQKSRRIGVKKLLLESGVLHEDGSYKYPIDAHTIGFTIAPRLNAAGRIGHSNVAFQLLTTQRATDAVDLAYQLEMQNKERQELTEQYIEEGIKQLANQSDAAILCVVGHMWPTGLVGLIASRIKSTFQKPTLVLSSKDHEIVGSGRSIEGFNFVLAMQRNPHLFEKFGGHPMAGGFTLAQGVTPEQMIAELTKDYKLQEEDHEIAEILHIDAEVSLNDISWELYETLEQFEPFGQMNQRPLFLAKEVTVTDVLKMGKDSQHLKLHLSHDHLRRHVAVGWRMCDGTPENVCTRLKKGAMIDIVFDIRTNEWNGNKELQLQIVDIDLYE